MSHLDQHDSIKKKKKKSERYCICRKGYDGKEFMIECDGCQEWFHGDCVGLTPTSVTERYFCQSCNKKKTLIILKPTLPSPPVHQSLPVISKLSIHEETTNEDDDMDDDICILCDGECTCGPSIDLCPPTPPVQIEQTKQEEIDNQNVSDDEEIVVDDLDDLLETMSPLSNDDHTDDSLSENQEFFTDNDDMELEETQQIIDDFNESDTDEEEEDSDESDDEEIVADYTFVEDDYENEQEPDGYSYYRRWSSSTDEEDEDVEFDFSQTEPPESDQQLLENDDSNLYDNITSAFIHALAPIKDGQISTGTNTPILNEDQSFSSQELSNILSTLSAQQRDEDVSRRPSLPSSALSAAQQSRGSLDMSSSEALRALSAFNLPLSSIEEQVEESQDTEQKKVKVHKEASTSSPNPNTLFSSETSHWYPLSIKQTNIQLNLDDGSILNKRKAINADDENEKKRRTSRSNSFSTFETQLQPLEINSFSTPVSPTEVSMDDLLDTSQLYSLPEVEDDAYSNDLSRWQRIPIGAFRLMRSKNKLWLER